MAGISGRIPTAAIASVGLIGGYGVARFTKKRPLGGLVLGAAGVAAGLRWHRVGGAPAVAGLGTLYLAGFAGSHPLAKRIGAWPAVLAVTATVSAAAWFASDLRDCPEGTTATRDETGI
ncbi:hypothetical protein ACN20G_16955 [Streptomyces sp. BI20]|uniref:hypothetical protein n=1 Tax=Streptomyces sp. BI20 TaxID=3403460 RepID=UPI003C75F091